MSDWSDDTLPKEKKELIRFHKTFLIVVWILGLLFLIVSMFREEPKEEIKNQDNTVNKYVHYKEDTL